MDQCEQRERCEEHYWGCYCRRARDGFFVRLSDPALPEEPLHNCLQLKKQIAPRLLRKTLEERLQPVRAGRQPFLALRTAFDPAACPEAFPAGAKVVPEGVFVLEAGRAAVEAWPASAACKLRALTAADLPALETVQAEAAQQPADPARMRRLGQRRGQAALSVPELQMWLAWAGECPAGKCALYCRGGAAKLENLSVVPELRRQGIATALLRRLTLEALDAGCTQVYLTAQLDTGAPALYRSLGFVPAERSWISLWRPENL